jgi:DNA polymerase-3 subunit epsilon
LHGALLDSEILAEVYLELIGGRQPDFALTTQPDQSAAGSAGGWSAKARATALPSRLTDSETAAHAEFVSKLGDDARWAKS